LSPLSREDLLRLLPRRKAAAAKAGSNGAAPAATGANPAAATGGQAATQPPQQAPGDVALAQQRDRLLERFTIMQADLGGAFYEMAIRDHVRLDALTRKAAELQRVDAELGQLERRLGLQRTGAVGTCSNCASPYGPGEVYCSQCGKPLTGAAPR
jgi:hypothetical protein